MARPEQPVTIKISGVGKTVTLRSDSEDYAGKTLQYLLDEIEEQIWKKMFPSGRYRCRVSDKIVDQRPQP